MFLYYVVRVDAYCVSTVFDAFRLNLGFGRVLVNFRVEVILYSNGWFAWY